MNIVKKIISIVQEDIIGTDNRLIAVAWTVCLSLLLGVGFYLSSESRSFLGVADSREQQISFTYPVEIKQINIIPGEDVKKGDLLVELDQSELNEKIRMAHAALDKLESEKSVRRHLNLIVNNNSSEDNLDPLSVEIKDLKEQIEGLDEQKKNLYVFATTDGTVGAVNFRKGEKVSAFTIILTLSSQSPTYVQGFVHESVNTKLEIGKVVKVVPLSSQAQPVEGKIVSVGSRIILMPARLMSYPNMQVYGHEVLVEIPENNNFLLGEKVQIKPRFDFIQVSQANASGKENNLSQWKTQEPVDIQFPASLKKRFSFEPSGIVYLEDLKKFLVISDDTDKEKSATLFLMNADGSVDEQTMTVPGVDKVSDFESISQDGSTIYLLTSQGANSKGKDKPERNQFIRFKRDGLNLSQTEVVDFKPILLKGLQMSSDTTLKGLVASSKAGDFEIEGHFVIDKDLYLGFKNLLTEKNQSVIIKIINFETLFSKKTLAAEQLSLWHTLDFKSVEGAPHRISDIIKVDGVIYVTTVCKLENCGALWKLQDDKTFIAPRIQRFYEKSKPEGVAFNSKEKSLLVVFDHKEKPAQFSRLHLDSQLALETVKKAKK